MLGGTKAAYDAARAKLAAVLMSKVPGIRSDSDFRNIVDPILTGRLDSPEEKAAKEESFKTWLDAQAPSAPLLESVGVDSNNFLNPEQKKDVDAAINTKNKKEAPKYDKDVLDYANTHGITPDEALHIKQMRSK